MDKKQRFLHILYGFLAGILDGEAVWPGGIANVPVDASVPGNANTHYNGVDTIARKTRYAGENLGGIMIWELTQDTSDPEKSLLQTIGENRR